MAKTMTGPFTTITCAEYFKLQEVVRLAWDVAWHDCTRVPCNPEVGCLAGYEKLKAALMALDKEL